jgi:hypothetical protein
LVAWFKADTLGLADGAAVTSWADSSGNGRDATQGTAGAQPTCQTNELLGLPVVRFDGGDNLVTAAYTQPGNWTAFAVANNTGAGYPAGVANTRGGNHACFMRWTSSTVANTFVGNNVGGNNQDNQASTAANRQILSARAEYVGEFGNGQIWVNGTSDGTSTIGGFQNTSSTPLYLGAGNTTTEPLIGDIAEFFYFDTALSTGDRQSMEQYLSDKWITAPWTPETNADETIRLNQSAKRF